MLAGARDIRVMRLGRVVAQSGGDGADQGEYDMTNSLNGAQQRLPQMPANQGRGAQGPSGGNGADAGLERQVASFPPELRALLQQANIDPRMAAAYMQKNGITPQQMLAQAKAGAQGAAAGAGSLATAGSAPSGRAPTGAQRSDAAPQGSGRSGQQYPAAFVQLAQENGMTPGQAAAALAKDGITPQQAVQELAAQATARRSGTGAGQGAPANGRAARGNQPAASGDQGAPTRNQGAADGPIGDPRMGGRAPSRSASNGGAPQRGANVPAPGAQAGPDPVDVALAAVTGASVRGGGPGGGAPVDPRERFPDIVKRYLPHGPATPTTPSAAAGIDPQFGSPNEQPTRKGPAPQGIAPQAAAPQVLVPQAAPQATVAGAVACCQPGPAQKAPAPAPAQPVVVPQVVTVPVPVPVPVYVGCAPGQAPTAGTPPTKAPPVQVPEQDTDAECEPAEFPAPAEPPMKGGAPHKGDVPQKGGGPVTGGGAPGAAPTDAPTPAPPTSPTTGAGTIVGVHTVAAGDNLSTIAPQHDLSWRQLYWANRDQIANPDLILPGQQLLIPAPDLQVPDFAYTPTYGPYAPGGVIPTSQPAAPVVEAPVDAAEAAPPAVRVPNLPPPPPGVDGDGLPPTLPG